MANISNYLTFELPYGVTVSTYVLLIGGNPAPFVTFTSKDGEFGTISAGTDGQYIYRQFYVGSQCLNLIQLFYTPPIGSGPGQVFAFGEITDVNGENALGFDEAIASYPQLPWPTT